MKVKVTVKLNENNIKKLKIAALRSLPLTLEAMKTELMAMQVVPKDIGTLEESATVGVENGAGFISFSTPYARRLYYHPEYNFRTDKNPNAQGRWMDGFIHGEKKDWLTDTYGKFLKNNAGGVIK